MFTVNELKKLCEKEIEWGNGEKRILLRTALNDYYPLEYAFSDPADEEEVKTVIEACEEEEENVIILN